MPVAAQPFRFHRRFALNVAIWFVGTAIQTHAWGQTDQPDASVAEVVVSPPETFPIREIERLPDKQQTADSGTGSEGTKAEESTKSTFVFSPVEVGPIRPSKVITELPLPPRIAARREEIERTALARIFAAGMVDDSVKFVAPPEPELVPSARGARIADMPTMVIAQLPDQPQVTPDIALPAAESESVAAGLEPTNGPMIGPMIGSLPQEDFWQGDLIVSDVVIETQKLPKPVFLGEPLLASPAEQVLPGMIEDCQPSLIVVPDFQIIAGETVIEVASDSPGKVQLPGYAMPAGGLDVYLLAPTRFSKPLPNAQ
jgi:hypothetical protein